MIIHKLVQGSPEWIAFRFEHFGASEAAAMLGLSSKMTRTELLHMKHVGSQKKFSDYVQERILNEGHRVEGSARPIMVKRFGEKLYPVTCSEGKLSASCDGLTMDESKGWEHKQWNQALAEAVATQELPDEYMVQPQQCMLVTRAEEWMFTVSDGTEENMVSMVIKPNPVWFDRIVKGWEQFERDQATYVPATPEVKAVGVTPETLPALFVELTGAVTASNLDAYKEHALAVIGAINRDLQTDQDFADASKAVKWCGEVESRLKAVKEHALSQTQTIDQLFKAIDDITAKARDTRLDLDKLVTRRNTERKEEIVLGGRTAYRAHIDDLVAETEGLWVQLPTPDFAGCIKGMRLLSNMQDAVNTLLANSKIVADDSAKKIRANLALLAEVKEYAFLFNDRGNLIAKAADDLKLLIKSRIDAHKAEVQRKEEATRERIRAEVEQQERAKAEHNARVQAEAEDALVSSFESNARRIEHDSVPYIEKALTAYKSTAKDWADDPRPRIATAYAAGLQYLLGRLDAAQQREAAQASADAIANAAKHGTVITAVPEANVQIVTAPQGGRTDIVDAEVPAGFVAPTGPRVIVPLKPTTPPTMSLGEISTKLGFNVTSAFLATLGFEATTVKAAKMFHSEDFPAICRAIIEHIESVCELQAA